VNEEAYGNTSPIAYLTGWRRGEVLGLRWENVDRAGRLFHDLLRTCARDLLRAGVPQAVAQKITGHLTDSMFRRYAIVESSMQLEALQKRNAYLQGAAKDASAAEFPTSNSDTNSDNAL